MGMPCQACMQGRPEVPAGILHCSAHCASHCTGAACWVQGCRQACRTRMLLRGVARLTGHGVHDARDHHWLARQVACAQQVLLRQEHLHGPGRQAGRQGRNKGTQPLVAPSSHPQSRAAATWHGMMGQRQPVRRVHIYAVCAQATQALPRQAGQQAGS